MSRRKQVWVKDFWGPMWRGGGFISRGDFILLMKVMAPVIHEGRKAAKDSGTTVLSEEVTLSSVLFFLTFFL